MTSAVGGRGDPAPPGLPHAANPGGGVPPVPERISLRARLRRAERRQKLRALGLIAPLFIFLALNFVLPISLMLFRAVDDREVGAVFPRTVAALRDWDGRALPGFEAYRYVVLRVPGLWWQIPFFYVPVLSRLFGHPIYNWIASNRSWLSRFA